MPGIYIEFLRGGEQDGAVLRLAGGRFTAGRSATCDVRFVTDTASREHAEFRLSDGTWMVRDLESANGTFVNGHRVETSALRPMDVLMFGEAGPQVRVVSLDPAPPISADGEDKTRFLRVAPRSGPTEKPAGPKVVRPKKERAPPPEPGHREPREEPRPRPMPEPRPVTHAEPAPPAGDPSPMDKPWLAAAGFAFGLVTAWHVWGDAFPYDKVLAPVFWLFRGLVELKVEPSLEAIEWIGRAGAALWFACIGFALQRPFHRIFWLLALLVAHGLAIILMGNP